MKILHIAPLSPYNVGWGYQDNLLPKYQRKAGHDVCVVVSPFENSENGKVFVGECDFLLDDGVHVYRRCRKFGNNAVGKAISFTDVSDVLATFRPDFVMIHSLMTLSVFQVIQYKKKVNPNCVIIQDNHLDENIGRRKNKLLTDLFYSYWAMINRFSEKYIARYYGVTPWRVDFIVNRFRIKREKTDLLIMGADTDDIDFSKREEYRRTFDAAYGTSGDFLIITGGKIEANKKTAELMRAVKGMHGAKLIVFGNIAEEYAPEIERSRNENTMLLGWKSTHEINRLFLTADLAVFPGQHSVLWEQACACKLPCVFAYWDGMQHLDNGGNCDFMKDTTQDSIRKVIEKYFRSEAYFEMLKNARSEKTDIFSYDSIAKKSLETAMEFSH